MYRVEAWIPHPDGVPGWSPVVEIPDHRHMTERAQRNMAQAKHREMARYYCRTQITKDGLPVGDDDS